MTRSYESFAANLRRNHALTAGACAAAFVLCLLLTHPFVEMALCDDFSYVYTSLVLAKTGHIVYPNWGAPPLGWQAYLGAMFIRLFGFSSTTVRASGALISVLTVLLSYRVFLRFGVRSWNAAFGTLAFALSPLFLTLSTHFMTDITSFFCMLLCLYSCLRAVQAETDSAAIAWLAFAAITNILDGTVRQVVWLGCLVMVPSTAIYLRKRRGMLPAGILLLIVSGVAVFKMMDFYQHQPWLVHEPLAGVLTNPAWPSVVAKRIGQGIATLGFLLIPVLLAFAAKYPLRKRYAQIVLFAVLAALAVTIGLPWLRHGTEWFPLLLPGNYISAEGTLNGQRAAMGKLPQIIHPPMQALLTLITASILAMAAGWLAFANQHRTATRLPITKAGILWLLGPFTLVYFLLSLSRFNFFFDRYLLPVEFSLIALLLILHQTRIAGRIAGVCWIPLLIIAAFAIATTHDAFATARAQLNAANALRAAGVPRSQIRVSMEYDGWTQIELDGRMENWSDAASDALPQVCSTWYSIITPRVQARYILSIAPTPCFSDSGMPPVQYTTWFAPRHRAVYIREIHSPPNTPAN